jgi:hypothetical protein
MARFLAPKDPDPGLPVFFNVDADVGAPPARNLREDVLLVQFLFQEGARTPSSKADQKVVNAARAVQVTGIIDPATVTAIRVLQEVGKARRPGTIVDGRVSPARGDYAYGPQAFWTIVVLNNAMQNQHLDIWPRIDRIPGCPPELRAMVIRTVGGTGRT